MQNNSTLGKSVRAFFNAGETKDLFSKCPLRRDLDHLHEFDGAHANDILAHMLGHILDYKAGRNPGPRPSQDEIRGIAQDNIEGELRYVYNDCNNAVLNEERRPHPHLQPHDDPEYQGFGPEQRNCCGADARAELMAEAIRAYLQNPAYLKAVAPNVAARIRAAVNTNPDLNCIIQFN